MHRGQPRKRALAKLMLNSFWGKFGQRENRPQTTIVRQPIELYALLTVPTVVVKRALPCGDTCVYVGCVNDDNAADILPTVNVVIAAYTTAQVRLKLYDYLQPLDRSVLYFDTDYVIYNHRAGDYKPEIGNFLGDLNDELQYYGQGSYIDEFVCGGSKNYSFTVCNERGEVVKSVCFRG